MDFPKSEVEVKMHLRRDVHEFIVAAEKLLSPTLRVSPLTDVECEYIREYLMTMSRAGHPWSNGLPNL